MKKGISLIEVLVGAALFFVLISVVGDFFIKEYKVYKKECVLHKEKIAIYDTAAFIECIIKNKIVSVENKKIVVLSEAFIRKEIIYSKNDIKVLTYKTKDLFLLSTNSITPYGIKDFKAEIIGNYLLVLYIKSWEGYEYTKCIPI